MRYFLEITFNGTSFHGWQIQPNAVSVQAVIEKALSTVLGHETTITGAGRTDSGVHARQMFAHFDTNREIKDKNRFLLSINSLSGKDILIKDFFRVNDNFHARFDAVKRTYKYYVAFLKNPFLRNYTWQTNSFLDIDVMNQCAETLIGTHDFTSFAKLHSDAKTNICSVTKAEWKPIKDDKEAYDFIGDIDNGIVFTISADRFLRNMVRAIVGTLIEAGRGKLSVEGFRDVILQQNRCVAGVSMPAQGLFLWEILYNYNSSSIHSN